MSHLDTHAVICTIKAPQVVHLKREHFTVCILRFLSVESKGGQSTFRGQRAHRRQRLASWTPRGGGWPWGTAAEVAGAGRGARRQQGGQAVPPWEPQGLCLLLPGPSCHASHRSTANGTSGVTALPASLTPACPLPRPPRGLKSLSGLQGSRGLYPGQE